MNEDCDKIWNYYIEKIYEGPDDDLLKIQDCAEWLEHVDLFDIATICTEYCDFKDVDDVEKAAEEIVNRMLKGLDKAEDIILQQEYPLCSTN